MEATLATSPGHPGRPNEDFVGAVPDAVVLLDGAGIPGTEAICRHGVAWYSHTLGATLLGRLSRAPDADLTAVLAEAIVEVSDRHRHTCDLDDPRSPQATVAMLRLSDDRADHLVLADAFVVLDATGREPRVITDSREVDVRRECAAPLSDLTSGTPDYERAERTARDELRARRNQPGGYWIAKDDPAAAMHAVTGNVPLDGLAAAALLSNGTSRLVDPWRALGWPALLGLLRTDGPDEVIRRVRDAEATGGHPPDDATVASCRLATSERLPAGP